MTTLCEKTITPKVLEGRAAEDALKCLKVVPNAVGLDLLSSPTGLVFLRSYRVSGGRATPYLTLMVAASYENMRRLSALYKETANA